MSKPEIYAAAQELIDSIRDSMPFDVPEATLCDGICIGCPKKLLNYIEVELDDWQLSVDQKEKITLGDLNKLGRQAQKIYRVLQKNNLVS